MYNRYCREHEVTLGEILASVIIVLLFILVGIVISNLVVSSIESNNEKYENAMRFSSDEQALFEYSMRTNVGNSLVNGTFKAVDNVFLDELKYGYMYVEKVKERYTLKTRIKQYEDSFGNKKTKVETYKEWDRVGADEYYNQKVTFMGIVFDSSKFDYSEFRHRLNLGEESVDSAYENRIRGNYLYEESTIFNSVGDVRYLYNVVPAEVSGTIFAKLADNDISGVETKRISVYNKNIDELLLSIEKEAKIFLIFFWIFWIVGIVVFIFFFVRKRNRWADIVLKKNKE